MEGRYAERIREAFREGRPLVIRGGGTKGFYGNPTAGEVLDTRELAGNVDYQPRELVIVASAGTPLAELESLVDRHGQMLPFEPPHFAAGGTLGGCIAAGLSGPRRAYAGAVRDFVLGVTLIDGCGQRLRFGGRVLKNVAGYDVSRLLTGALGTLGMIVEVALKLLPRPALEVTRRFELGEAESIRRMNEWAGRPLPLSATSWQAGRLTVRLSGAAAAVRAAEQKLGGETVTDAGDFWRQLRDQAAPFFRPTAAGARLWRLAVRSTSPPLNLGVAPWIEWGGAVRWIATDRSADVVRAVARAAGGHAQSFRGPAPADGAFAPLEPAMFAIHRNLKQRFDPAGILNRGRLYPGL